jgi:hypothetical protein
MSPESKMVLDSSAMWSMLLVLPTMIIRRLYYNLRDRKNLIKISVSAAFR